MIRRLSNWLPKGAQNWPTSVKSLIGGLPKPTPKKQFQKAPILLPSGLPKWLFFIIGVIKNLKSRVPEKTTKMTYQRLLFCRLWGSKIFRNPVRKGIKKTYKLCVQKKQKWHRTTEVPCSKSKPFWCLFWYLLRRLLPGNSGRPPRPPKAYKNCFKHVFSTISCCLFCICCSILLNITEGKLWTLCRSIES